MIYKIYLLLEKFTDPSNKSKIDNLLYNIFIPFFFIMEWICLRHYWKKIVLNELLTSDAIVEFLDKQEFGFKNQIIYKADLLSSNEFFDRINMEEAKHIIKKEYVETFSKLLETNISLNIEEYINLLVNVEMKVINKNDEIYREKIYTITIQFCRQFYFDFAKRKTKNWFIILLLLGIIFFISKFYLYQLI